MAGESLPNSWRWVTLEEVAAPNGRAIVSGPFGSNIGSRFFVESGVPVIRGNNLTIDMTRFVDDGFVFVTDEKADELGNCDAFPGDLVFTAAGSLGQVGIVPYTARYPRYIISNKQLRARVDERIADPLFAFYWFSSPRMVAYIQQRNTGSSVPLINLSVLRSLPMPLPPIAEQRAIAHILGSLDDKIELNRRMNETLEEMARAIFKSWFVDFDPVRAKMEGRQPAGMDGETAALFPDSFEDSLLGEIPKGWRADSFSEMIDLLGGGTPKTSVDEYWNGEIPWFSVVDAPRDSDTFVISTEKQITESGVTNSSTKILPVGTTIISARGTVGKCALVGVPMAMNQSCYGLRGRDERGDYFTYFATRRMVAELQRHAHGSVFSTITRNTFRGIKVAIPHPDLTRKYDEAVNPYMWLILANLHQSRILAAIRDALLPKLLSGEIRVRQAEEVVEETA